ncbi:MAG: prenyltransferase [Acidobacteriota bacterium]
MATLRAYLGVARAPFLLLPVTLVAAGAAAAAFGGVFSWPRTALAVLGLVAAHVGVNVLNEASDMRTGIDLHTERTPFSGGSGTLPGQAMSLRTATIFGLLACAVALAIGVWFVTQVGWILVPVLAAGAVAILLYTDVFARAGVGELVAGLGLGALPVWGSALVQGGAPGPGAFAAAVPAFFMTFDLLLLNEFPDERPDRLGGRRNLVLRLGRRAAARVYAGAAIAVPTAILVAVAMRVLPLHAALAVLPSLLLVRPLGWAFGDTGRPVPVPALAANVTWNLATNALLAAGLVLAR